MISKDAPKMQVKCGVDDCEYNKDRMCHADDLQINTMVDPDETRTTDETCCMTFKCDK